MTYARLRDILNTMDRGELDQEAVYLIHGKIEKIEQIESFRGDKVFASRFGGQPHQVFLTNFKEF
ncbi:MAG: hypothetical protein EBU90_18735 [Proteobacteria bacterium]|nr:hypothetical protein [Pseudomonadota bacterium]NBP16681.1 hypothetical protein [bacterium]